MPLIRLQFIAATALMLAALAGGASDYPTTINDAKAKVELLGERRLAVQWISWDRFGKVAITDDKGVWRMKGEQRLPGKSDFLTIDGIITEVNAKDFQFRGTIITQVTHIANGRPCKREGEFTFKITGNRRYWRMAQMENPCDGVVDYIDVFMNPVKPAGKN
jgi:hypothetical protein